jgi:CubicO group peptidase (beta-lactamase class C family)
MRLKIWTQLLSGLLFVILGSSVAVPRATTDGRTALAEGKPPSDDVSQLIHEIEAPQVPNRQGLDGMTLQEVMQKFHIQGLSIAVIKDFKIQWAKGYGVADVQTGRPVETNTLFQAASISKPVTAMAALRLAQEGRFSLDEDVNKLLKSWQVPASDLTREQPVTPRSLMSHTSGSDDGFGFPGYAPGSPLPTLVQILNGQPPSNVGPVLFKRPPYQAYKYSGGGIVIEQLMLTDLLGQPFDQIMQNLILKPLGMSDSTYQQPLPKNLEAWAARAYDEQGHAMDAPWHVYPEQAAAGLWTTASDLARVAIEVQRAIRGPEGAVLKQATAREMVAPTGVGPFAIGFEIAKNGEGWYFSHSGGNWGFACHLLAHVRKGYGVAIMTNGDLGGRVTSEVEARVAAAYHWDSLDKPLVR